MRALDEPYDVVVIGRGAAGHGAAVRAGQLGLKVACVERVPSAVGTGTGLGCVAAKALLHASEVYETARSGAQAALGVEGRPVLNLARMMAYKNAAVAAMSRSVEASCRRHGVTCVEGEARLAGPGRVAVRLPDGGEIMLTAKDIVIATGSVPLALPGVAFDRVRIIDCADALSLSSVPARLAVVGAGPAGLEIGSIWRRLGAEVTVIDHLDRIGQGLDHDIERALRLSLVRQGLAFRLSSEVRRVDRRGAGVRLVLQDVPRGGMGVLDADLVLVAIGRRASTAALDLASVGLSADAEGLLPNAGHETAAPGVWVVGDATTGPMLAHKAAEEGIACIERIAGLPARVDYRAIPNVLYTKPEVAMIGHTEQDLRAAGMAFRIGRAAFDANARARIRGESEGFVKLLVDARSSLILGAHLIGAGVGEIVSQLSLAMEASALCEDLARACHPMPTHAEALRQAAMDAGGWMMQG